ncbi:hypothetical protein BBJ29_003926 [Phytophthora kernoviae]|uniref:Putative rRNA methyltransferase n=1 Tax=Phytophthora kernoviae TaxID=325452 RepID=A0A3F2S386_9STRA|nr:hypothetical protein BBJ29_003926 [Phytophthora kernoviae]RLN68884.1 hypothetical protein BBP00_00000728 [Phytophthora kernoviae]
MVKRKKHDKDKYYNLARQQGYRARSAFKLIQLNKKYDFLTTAKVCIDLCAAPGGWCQVAAKYMPASSIILGIDLLPIRPIRGVKTFQCDITTVKCRQIIKQEMQSWQADVVLCDGAPNVGAEYSKDAYVQNELALIALKLAVDVMGRGGTFVSKVFRSQDYNALLWVFKQLFKKVSATKPLSSRNESAEIFVVCEQFLAPQSIDPKLFDPKHVFDQVDSQEKSITIFHPKFGDRKRHREGYDEALGMSLTNECSVSQFIDEHDPIRLLTDTTRIVFRPEDDVYREHPDTSDEIATCLSDLKVLGKADFKHLLKWRTRMAKYKAELLKAEHPEEEDEKAKVEEVKEPERELTENEKDNLVREELSQLRANVLAKKKREKKKERERKQKLRIRAALGMNQEGIDVTEAESAFSLSELKLSKAKVDDLENADASSSEEEVEDVVEDENAGLEDSDEEYDELLEVSMEKAYDQFLSRRGDDVKTRKAVKRTKIAKRALAGEALVQDSEMFDGDMKQYQQMINPDESSDDSDSDGDLNVSLKLPEKGSAAVSRWFSDNKLFDSVNEKDAVSTLPEMPKTDKEIRHEKRKAALERKERRAQKKLKKEEKEYELEFGTEFDIAAPINSDDEMTAASADESENEESAEKKALIRSGMGAALSDDHGSSDKIEVVAAGAEPEEGSLPVMDDRKYDSDHEEYGAEDRAKTLALASMMVQKSKAKDMIDASYNRYTWNDSEALPDWFLDDEEKHYRPQIPIPKNVINQMRERFMEMATKPVKKVAEARGRKQRLQMKKMKAAKKKATDIANLPDMSTREKLKAIDRAMNGARLSKESKVYVVSTRGGSKTVDGKKGAKKGKVKLVDPRMKSDKYNSDKRAKRGKKRKR